MADSSDRRETSIDLRGGDDYDEKFPPGEPIFSIVKDDEVDPNRLHPDIKVISLLDGGIEQTTRVFGAEDHQRITYKQITLRKKQRRLRGKSNVADRDEEKPIRIEFQGCLEYKSAKLQKIEFSLFFRETREALEGPVVNMQFAYERFVIPDNWEDETGGFYVTSVDLGKFGHWQHNLDDPYSLHLPVKISNTNPFSYMPFFIPWKSDVTINNGITEFKIPVPVRILNTN